MNEDEMVPKEIKLHFIWRLIWQNEQNRHISGTHMENALGKLKHLAYVPSYLCMWPTAEEMYICIGNITILGSLNMILPLVTRFGPGWSADRCSGWFVLFVWSGSQQPKAALWRTGLPWGVLEFLLQKLLCKAWQCCLNTWAQVLISVDFLGEQLLDFFIVLCL